MKLKYLSVFGCVAVLLAGCTEEQVLTAVGGDSDLIPISVNSSINQQATKATAEGFVDKDAVGLFAVNYTRGNTVAGTLLSEGNQADNVKYIFDEANFKWNPVKPVYYKDINTHADLYLYYPYLASITEVNAAGFEVKKDQSAAATATSLSGYEASDFLWGKGEDITPSQSAVSIRLSHKMAAVQVTLQEGSGFETGEFESLEKSIILTGTTRKATIDYATGTVTALGNPQQDGIVMCPQSDGSWRAIAVPQSIAAGQQLFAITVNGMSYKFSQAEATEYQSGKQTNFTITVKKKTPSGEYEFTLTDAQITDWTEDKNTHGGEARQYFVVNVSEPGTLGATIKSMGKNPDKIRNLKVVGTVRDDDFYFMRDSMAILEAVNMKESVIKSTGKAIAYTYKSYPDFESYYLAYGEPDYVNGDYCRWFDEDGDFPDDAFKGKKSLCYFVFPEYVKSIGEGAFNMTTLSGALIIPEDVERIGNDAFYQTALSSVTFNNKTKSIGQEAFYECKSLSGRLVLPEALVYIGSSAFHHCSFNGDLYLPDNLETINPWAFYIAGSFSSGLRLPDKVKSLGGLAFASCDFKGKLDLNNCTQLGESCFSHSGFSGDLIIPEGTITIPRDCFSSCNFSKIICPESLRTIDESAFYVNRLEEVTFKEGLVSIAGNAFVGCSSLLSLHLPSTLQTIGAYAFANCYYLSNITCDAVEPPTVQSNTFNGVAKDNFVLEVPEQSIVRYQTEVGWSDFKRITAHYDFSIGRTRMRALNAGMERTYTLRCPAGNDWSVSDKPDWITVTPSSGTGKTDVTITVSEMPRTTEQFEVNTGSFQYPSYKNYKGRKDAVVFALSGKDYTCKLEVEQYDYGKADGEVITHQTHSTAKGIDIVFIGEGYDARDIADGKFERDCENGYKHFFDIEPYKTYKDYFNVYSVVSQSDESGIETVNTIIANKFMKNGIRDIDAALSWAKKARVDIDLTKTVVILLDNSKNYYGWTNMYGDGSAMSVVPISEEPYPYDFRGLIQHEAGGHAFGKLGDEYIYHNSYITSCVCICCDHPSSEFDTKSQFGLFKSKGWFKNLSMNSDHNQVPWSHLLYNSTFSNRVDMYEGAYMHMRGMYRSEITSCMNNNIPYFNSISRQAIVERIKEYAGETFDFDDFVAKDNFDVGTKASMQNFDWTFGVDPKWNRGTEHGSIIYMGEHPNVK